MRTDWASLSCHCNSLYHSSMLLLLQQLLASHLLLGCIRDVTQFFMTKVGIFLLLLTWLKNIVRILLFSSGQGILRCNNQIDTKHRLWWRFKWVKLWNTVSLTRRWIDPGLRWILKWLMIGGGYFFRLFPVRKFFCMQDRFFVSFIFLIS